MKGFKALNKDMTSKYGNMAYEIGKEYILEEELELCTTGFHFSRNMHEPFVFYDKCSRLFEIEASGKILEARYKLCTNKIKLIREISVEEIEKYFMDNLDKLIDDEDWCIRRAVAKQGYGLDKLVNDEDWRVRCEVATQGYGLDKLIADEDWRVRCVVASQGHGLVKLISDENWHVRYVVEEKSK